MKYLQTKILLNATIEEIRNDCILIEKVADKFIININLKDIKDIFSLLK